MSSPGTAPGAAASSGPVRRARSSSRVCEREVRASSQSRREPAPYGLSGSNVVDNTTSVRSASASGARSRSPSARDEHTELATGMRSNNVQPVWQHPTNEVQQPPLSPSGSFVPNGGGAAGAAHQPMDTSNGPANFNAEATFQQSFRAPDGSVHITQQTVNADAATMIQQGQAMQEEINRLTAMVHGLRSQVIQSEAGNQAQAVAANQFVAQTERKEREFAMMLEAHTRDNEQLKAELLAASQRERLLRITSSSKHVLKSSNARAFRAA